MLHRPPSTVHGLSSFDTEKVEAAAQALDLCLACKGCKSECPTGVDMAKLKFAFQEEYYKTHRRQLRDYVFGYFHIAAGLAASVAPISNALMSIPPIKKLVARILGITAHRPFPKFSGPWKSSHNKHVILSGAKNPDSYKWEPIVKAGPSMIGSK